MVPPHDIIVLSNNLPLVHFEGIGAEKCIGMHEAVEDKLMRNVVLVIVCMENLFWVFASINAC